SDADVVRRSPTFVRILRESCADQAIKVRWRCGLQCCNWRWLQTENRSNDACRTFPLEMQADPSPSRITPRRKKRRLIEHRPRFLPIALAACIGMCRQSFLLP